MINKDQKPNKKLFKLLLIFLLALALLVLLFLPRRCIQESSCPICPAFTINCYPWWKALIINYAK